MGLSETSAWHGNYDANTHPSGNRFPKERWESSRVLLILTAMFHEVTGVISFTPALTLLLESLRRKNRYEIATYSTALALITTLLLWYWRKPYTPNIYLDATPPGIVAYPAYPSVSAEA